MDNQNLYNYNDDNHQNNPNYQNSPVPPLENGSEPSPPNGFSTAALVLGIIAIVLGCCFYIAIPLGALAIIFSCLSKAGAKQMNGKARTGLILGIISLVLSIIFLIIIFAFNSISERDVHNFFSEFYGEESYDEYYRDFYGDGSDNDSNQQFNDSL